MEIELMAHHIYSVASLHGHEISDCSIFSKYSYDSFYGKGSAEKKIKWINSLNPNKTVIKIISDRPLSLNNTLNVDALCKGKNCIYQNTCREDVEKTFKKMFKRNPVLYPYLYLSALLNGNSEKKLRRKELFIGRRYSLSEIISRFK